MRKDIADLNTVNALVQQNDLQAKQINELQEKVANVNFLNDIPAEQKNVCIQYPVS